MCGSRNNSDRRAGSPNPAVPHRLLSFLLVLPTALLSACSKSPSAFGRSPGPFSALSALSAVKLRFLFLCAFSCLLAALSACSKSPTASAPVSILRLSQRNEPADLDPATATLPDEFFIIRALSEGLVVPAISDLSSLNHQLSTSSSSVLPATAASWSLSPDRLTCTFNLRRDATWSDGSPVTADDFLFSYRRLLTPATAAPKAALFFAVKNARAFATGALTDFSAVGFRAPDAHTLLVTLERPFPQFLLYAASGPWIPVNPRAVTAHGRAWTRPENYVGNGPYTLSEWRPHQRIVVKKNPRFRPPPASSDSQPSTLNSQLPQEIHFLAFDNGDTEERAYRAGQIDVTMSVPVSKIPAYATERPAEYHATPLAETRYLAFNTTRPPLDDRRVRRALSLALDRATLVARLLHGTHQPATNFVPPSLTHPSSSSSSSHSTYSPNEARALLAAAGYPRGAGFPRLELSSWPIGPPIAEALQQFWKTELGIEVSLVTREAKAHVAALREGRYDIAFITAIPDVPDPVNLLSDLVTASPANYPHWSDPHYDELVAAAATAEGEQRELLLESAEALLAASAPVAPLYYNSKTWLMSPRVHHWREDALWQRDYSAVSLDDE